MRLVFHRVTFRLVGGVFENDCDTQKEPQVMPSKPQKELETFDNPNPERDYTINIDCPEFTCLCPKTGQPDFADINVNYIPDKLCVELKSLKLYLWSFRDEGHFHEAVTNLILDDLVKATKPRRMTVTSKFKVRGGITTSVIVDYVGQPDSGDA